MMKSKFVSTKLKYGMTKMKKWLVVSKSNRVLKEFKSKERAIDFMINCLFIDNMEGVKVIRKENFQLERKVQQ